MPAIWSRIGRVPGPYRPELGPGLRGDQLGAGRGARPGRRDRLAAARPARRRGDLGRRSARARHRRRGGLDRRRPRRASRTARPGCATATASRRKARCRTPTTRGDRARPASRWRPWPSSAPISPLSHPLRAALVARLGERGFLGLYSLVAFATLGWMILAWRGGDRCRAALGRAALVVAGRLGADAVREHPPGRLAGPAIPAFPHPGAPAAGDPRRRAACSRSPAIR